MAERKSKSDSDSKYKRVPIKRELVAAINQWLKTDDAKKLGVDSVPSLLTSLGVVFLAKYDREYEHLYSLFDIGPDDLRRLRFK